MARSKYSRAQKGPDRLKMTLACFAVNDFQLWTMFAKLQLPSGVAITCTWFGIKTQA